jgi:hypothetical protein
MPSNWYVQKDLKEKEELWKNLNISPCQKKKKKNHNLQKKILENKETKILQYKYYNSLTNLKFENKPKYHLSKILIKKKKKNLLLLLLFIIIIT